MSERWLPIPGYEGAYQVSDHGRVRSLSRIDASGGRRLPERLLRPGTSTTGGHLKVTLYLDRTRRTASVHHLVLIAFVGPRPDGMEACHWDDDPSNNHLSNLRWDTRSANQRDRVRNGNNNQANKTQCPKGHAFDDVNTYRRADGRRGCRECFRLYREEHRDEIRMRARDRRRQRQEAIEAEVKALTEDGAA